MLQLKNVKKDYATAGNVVRALRGVSLRFRKNEFVSVLGPSGCGKTTLLNIIGGLDHYTSGDLVICGVSTKDYKDHDWDVYRNHRIGFVFQSYNLIPHQTVLANVELALTIAGVSKRERKRRATEALIKVGLKNELHKRPNQLSGGQMQRVAIARALVNNPEILLADEPTGALDTTTSVQIMELIREIAGERLVIMVTHNPELAEEYSSRIVRLQDGLVVSDSNPYDGREEMEENVFDPNADYQDVDVNCPKCGTPLHLCGVHPTKGASVTCPICEENFKLKPKAKPVPAIDCKAEKKERKKAEKRKKKENASMSYATSLGLSARNLATKKGRTAITSVAGSIGIISVCLVLALSNGFNGYIKKTQEDMLSSYPLEITETTLNVEAIMTGMTAASDLPDLDKIGDRVYVNSFLTNIAQGMTVNNNLSDEYIEYLESMDEEWYTAIVYGTGMSLTNNLYTQVQVEENGATVEKVMSLSELKAYYTFQLTQQEEKYASLAYLVDYLGSVYGKMPGTTDVTSENYGDYVLSQYDVIEGHFPKTANEAVLVVGGNNDVTDLTLAQLGFIGEKDFLALFPQEGEDVGDSEDYQTMIDFDKVIGKKFMLNYNDAIYTPAAPTSSYLYDYQKSRTEIGEDGEDGKLITISGVLRLKDGYNYGCLTSGLYLTEQVCNEYLEVNMQSKLSKTILEQSGSANKFGVLAQELALLTQGTPEYMQKIAELMRFLQTCKPAAENLVEYYIAGDAMGGDENGGAMDALAGYYFLYGDSAIRAVGGKDTVNSIQIYTDDFDSKEQILSWLDTWNDEHETGEQVKYTDTVGMMMTMVETILNAITYVLVAFTAISLVVSSVMIGIITYVSVVERTKEIGVLRSLGARKKDIKNLFNAETFIIGLSSGVFGVVVTYALQFGVNAILGALTGISTLAALPLSSALIMVAVSIGLTLISGLIPASAAAKKDPVIALRTE